MKRFEGTTTDNQGDVLEVYCEANTLEDAWVKLEPPINAGIILHDIKEVSQ